MNSKTDNVGLHAPLGCRDESLPKIARADLLSGIDYEKKRLQGKGYVVTHLRQYCAHGVGREEIWLREGFDDLDEARRCVDRLANAVLAEQLREGEAVGQQWYLDWWDESWTCVTSTEVPTIKVVYAKSLKMVRSGGHYSIFTGLQVLEVATERVVGGDLFTFLGHERELRRYFMAIGKEVRRSCGPAPQALQEGAGGRSTAEREWGYVEEAARQAFGVWGHGRGLEWARAAWQCLTDDRLVHVEETEREYNETGARFLALAGIYHDFCRVARDENDAPDYTDWATELGMSRFWVALLAGETCFDDRELAEDYFEEDDVYPYALQHIANGARGQVLRALLDGFGGVAGLFASMWQSTEPRPERALAQGMLVLDDEESTWDVLSTPTPEKAAAYEWVEEGCTPLTEEAW